MDQLPVNFCILVKNIPRAMPSSLSPYLLLTCLALLLFSCNSPQAETMSSDSSNATVWAGTYTKKEGHVDGKAAGIYRLELDRKTGAVQLAYTQDDIINPSFVTLSPDRNFLYAVSETGPDVDTNTAYVHAYAIGKDGQLDFINRQPSYSFAPCYASVHPGGKWLVITNYVAGRVVSYPLAADGAMGEAAHSIRLEGSGPTNRQEDSHPHSAVFSPDGKWLYVADLGTDKIMTFQFDELKGQLVAAASPFTELTPGAGPRHLVFHPSEPLFFCVNELNSTVTSFQHDAETGSLTMLHSHTTLPEGHEGFNLCADIHISPDGQYLYASNRGHNSIAGFRITTSTGALRPLGHTPTGGDFPRNFALSPDGQFLLVANQNTDNILTFAVDSTTGGLSQLAESKVPTPVCLIFQ
jgi:6-phosphogluconolactonase